MHKITKVYYYDEEKKRFTKEYSLYQFKQLMTNPKLSEEYYTVKDHIYYKPVLIDGKPDENYRVFHHGKSKNEFHQSADSDHIIMYEEYGEENEETPEHKYIKEIIYDIAKTEHKFKVIVELKNYDLDIKYVQMEKTIRLSIYEFKPDIILTLVHNDNNKDFIEKYSDTIYLEICNTHPNTTAKKQAFQFENLFLVQLDVRHPYYIKRKDDSDDEYYVKKRKQLLNNYIGVDVQSNVLKDTFEYKIKADDGITYHLWYEQSDKKYYVKWYENREIKQVDNYKGRLFTKESAKQYILYRVRLVRLIKGKK